MIRISPHFHNKNACTDPLDKIIHSIRSIKGCYQVAPAAQAEPGTGVRVFPDISTCGIWEIHLIEQLDKSNGTFNCLDFS
jgi:hypothetical protein